MMMTLKMTQAWTNAIDRGGLKHINNMTYMLFVSMELELRKHLSVSESLGVKEKATESISKDEDVLFYWSLVSVNWEEEDAKTLLCMIIEHWITIQGFSNASAFMEKYKQAHKKGVQKSKGVRKQLLSSISTTD